MAKWVHCSYYHLLSFQNGCPLQESSHYSQNVKKVRTVSGFCFSWQCKGVHVGKNNLKTTKWNNSDIKQAAISSTVTSPINHPFAKLHWNYASLQNTSQTFMIGLSLLTSCSQCDFPHINEGSISSRPPTVGPLTDSETFWVQSSSAFFSRELTHSLRFCLQRDAAARFLSRKRCLRSSGSSSTVRRRRPPVGCAGDTWREKRGKG